MYAPPGTPFCMPYSIQYWEWQYRVKANILRNIRAIVLQQCDHSRRAGVVQGCLIRSQTPRSERISCEGQTTGQKNGRLEYVYTHA